MSSRSGPQGEEPRTARRLEPRFVAVAVLLLLLAGCHGGTLDSIYPGELGHRPPPAVNLPPQDQGMEQL